MPAEPESPASGAQPLQQIEDSAASHPPFATDTAHELWLILDKINQLPSSTRRTIQELTSFFKIPDDGSGIEITMRLAFLLARIRDVKHQVRLSRLIDYRKKDRIIKDMDDLSKTFQAKSLLMPWQNARAEYFKPEFLTRLDSVSDSLRHEFGFRQTTAKDADFLRDRIDAVLSSLGDDVDPSLASVIRDVMKSLRPIITNHPYIDPQQLTEKAIVANSILDVVSDRPKKANEQTLFRDAVTIVLTILNFYVIVPQIPNATEQFWGPAVRHVGELIANAKEQGNQPLPLPSDPPDPLLLPGPSCTEQGEIGDDGAEDEGRS